MGRFIADAVRNAINDVIYSYFTRGEGKEYLTALIYQTLDRKLEMWKKDINPNKI